MQHYDELARYERDGFDIVVDRTPEDMNPRDCFQVSDVAEICRDIDRGHYEWFMLRVRVLVEGLELSSECLRGCLYEIPGEVLTDGTAEEMIHTGLVVARAQVYHLSRVFTELSNRVDNQLV